MKYPLVSVIVPYYRKITYFKKTYDSILNQNYKNKEIIIIYDDKDLSDLIKIKKIIKGNTKLVINKKNLGAGLSRNKGINVSKGKYIAFIDSDDTWKKNKLSYQIKLMENKNLMFTHCSYNIVDENNLIVNKRIAKHQLTFKKLLKSCDIGLSSVVVNQKLVKKYKFPNLKTKEDFVLWLKISKKNEIVGLKKVMMNWHKSKDSLSSNLLQKLFDGYKVYNKYMKFSVFKSLIFLFILSVNFLRKN